jgi:hypothetical protein
MADPLSILAGITGIITFAGKAGGLAKLYLADYKRHGHDTAKISDKIDYLEKELQALKGVLLQLEPVVKHIDLGVSGLIDSNINLCHLELLRLETYLDGCRGIRNHNVNASGDSTTTYIADKADVDSPGTSATLRKRIRGARKRIAYPLKKQGLTELEQVVNAAHNQVRSSLSILSA